jgi:signal transduction histidine kinase
VGDFYHPQCDQSGVILRVQLPADELSVNVDEGLFKQAMLNLMINAVQAMSVDEDGRGELLIDAQLDGAYVVVSVTDTGPGIATERLEEIFHPYVSGRAGGTGLGLPTTRRIIEEHGGRLRVDSEVGQGTSFRIMFPVCN